jgi:hypothetical protein
MQRLQDTDAFILIQANVAMHSLRDLDQRDPQTQRRIRDAVEPFYRRLLGNGHSPAMAVDLLKEVVLPSTPRSSDVPHDQPAV